MRKHYTFSGLLLCLMTLLTLGASAAPDKNYLCFTANTAGSTVMLNPDGWDKTAKKNVEYSQDGETWNAIVDARGRTVTITLENAGDKVYFRHKDKAETFSTQSNQCYFELSGSVAASGNVMSLVDVNCATTTIPCDYCFCNLFKDCSALTTAPELPATTLAANCYENMFSGCTALTTAPELPATTLASKCYYNMFYNCTALTTAPELPATTLAANCYQAMFYSCTALETAPELPAKMLASYCYGQMFLACRNLTTAPELPATTLADYCYKEMFRFCNKLNVVKVGFSAITGEATYYWFESVASDGIFICPDDLGTTVNIPADWTVKNTYDVTGTAIGWTSLCVNLPLQVPEGAKVYYAKSVEGSTIELTQIEAGTVMAAKTAVIVKADASTTVQFPVANEDGTSYDNLFQGSSIAKAKTEDVYVLAGKSTPDKPVFQPYTGTTLGAHKIWLPKSAVGGASSIQFRFADATAVSTVETEAAEDVIYNLAGQRVGSDYRGLVIRNGKKMYNK